jgi:hypothetical protein
VVALVTVVGVPVSEPVVVLKLIPAGVSLISKLVIVPPVEMIVNPVAAELTVSTSDDDERVKAGTASVESETVSENVLVAIPLALIAVTMKFVELTLVGVPVSAPVVVLKLMPAGTALVAKLVISPPVEMIVKPVATV